MTSKIERVFKKAFGVDPTQLEPPMNPQCMQKLLAKHREATSLPEIRNASFIVEEIQPQTDGTTMLLLSRTEGDLPVQLGFAIIEPDETYSLEIAAARVLGWFDAEGYTG